MLKLISLTEVSNPCVSEKQVKQRTLLNIGKGFTIDQDHWPLLTAQIEQLLQDSEPHQV